MATARVVRHGAAKRSALAVVVAAFLGCGFLFAFAAGNVPLAAVIVAEAGAADAEGNAARVVVAEVTRNEEPERLGAVQVRDAAEVVPLRDTIVDDPRIVGWVRALHDDDVRWNARGAMEELRGLPAGRIPALESALRSFDLQQRMFAGMVLRARCDDGLDVPRAALFEVTVEALRSNVVVDDVGSFAYPLRATALWFLLPHAADAAPFLRTALGSNDLQQRTFAAFALAPVAGPADVPAVVAQLVGRLEDNQIAGDAAMAAHGLYRLGELALPALRAWRGHVDEQARSLIDLIALDLEAPPRDTATLRARGRTARVSTLYHDAVIEFDVRRSRLPRL